MDEETEVTVITLEIDSLSHEDLEASFYELMGVIVVPDMDEPALAAWQASHQEGV